MLFKRFVKMKSKNEIVRVEDEIVTLAKAKNVKACKIISINQTLE